MQYMGSKNRIAKHILPVILPYREKGMTWVEPFVGGANMIDKISGPRIGNDSHFYLIEMWKAMQSGWVPPRIVTKDFYYGVKGAADLVDPALVGFIGFFCSFGSKWWGGYASNSTGRNYASVAVNSFIKQRDSLMGVTFTNVDYVDMVIPKRSLIYCDPPYEGTTKYTDKFNHSLFWNWCREKSLEGHIVFISEYTAPEDFRCIKSVPITSTLSKNQKSEKVEKLFIAPKL